MVTEEKFYKLCGISVKDPRLLLLIMEHCATELHLTYFKHAVSLSKVSFTGHVVDTEMFVPACYTDPGCFF